MRFAALLLVLTNIAAAGSEISLPATRRAHVLILNEVYLNGAGPFRMMVDTANSSSLLSPSIAKRLALASVGMVEHAAPTGSRRVPIALLGEVRAGAAVDRDVEVMIDRPILPGVDGVLGQSWLARHDYSIDFHRGRLVLDGAPPEGGLRLPLRSDDGVPQIVGKVDGSSRALALDSGSPALVLFESSRLVRTARLVSHAGSAPATVGTALLSLAGSPTRRVAAVRVDTPGNGPALLGLCAYASVHVSNREGLVVLIQ